MDKSWQIKQTKPNAHAAVSAEKAKVLTGDSAWETNTYNAYGISLSTLFDEWAEEMDAWPDHWDFMCYGDQNHDYFPGMEELAAPGYYSSSWWTNNYVETGGEVVTTVTECTACGANKGDWDTQIVQYGYKCLP